MPGLNLRSVRWRWLVPLLMVLMVLRIAYICHTTRTGTNTLLWLFDDVVWWDEVTYVPLEHQLAEERAKFWVDEVKRNAALISKDATLAAGAALVLHDARRVDLDDEVREFESKCGELCLELATKATELEPDNQSLWRLRAVLLCSDPWKSRNRKIRSDDWNSVLNACRAHDPGNAF